MNEGMLFSKTFNHFTLSVLLLSHFSRVWLCNPIEGSPPGSSFPGILQARIMEWVAISSYNALSLAVHKNPCFTSPANSSGRLFSNKSKGRCIHYAERFIEHLWLSGKESACPGRRQEFDSQIRKIPCRRKWQSTPVFLLKNPWTEEPGGYSPCSHKESDRIERLNNSSNIKCRQLFCAWRHSRVKDKAFAFAGLLFDLEPNPKPMFSNVWVLLDVLQVKSSGANYIWKTLNYGIGN